MAVREKMVSPYSRLPMEVLIMILQQAPDLSSTYAFICASSTAKATFEIDPARILDAVLERSTPDIKHLELTEKYKARPLGETTKEFAAGTQGPRYVLLTAYRIEILQEMCLITLLRNFHDLIQGNERVDGDQSSYGFSSPSFWPPSVGEKIRVVTLLWKLMINWNICTICEDIKGKVDDCLDRYIAKIKHLDSTLGPRATTYDSDDSDDSLDDLYFDPYEYCGFKCVLATVRQFLGCADESFATFTSFFGQMDCPKFQIQKGPFSTMRKKSVSISWKLKEPAPPVVGEPEFREDLAMSYFLEHYGIRFQSWFGICIWDYTRLAHFLSSLERCSWARDWRCYIY
ncbi:uncharacterized protein TRUGW13939_06316 [Talaromyces rugulosus]|uniref:Uncharacterized protein n=1 Tax=Talaromyces rugulosus TaxID=121627 RepID=A0A7H8QYH9_TALRU|nr:uncharacterized protein TRUGW13939_06316 [Talaromyces rugulosus]QKX59184.1 hypothetical protein TRUGW13939_06316 [Talaromyces rugulosus]